MTKLKVVGLMLMLAYSQIGFSMTESDLTAKTPACVGKTKTIPQEVKSEPTLGSSMRAVDWLDIDADGQCDIVAFSQESMEDEGEQVLMFFMRRNKRYVYDSYDMAGRTMKLTPIYIKNGGPPFLVIHRTESKSSPPEYVVRRWEIKSAKFVTYKFLGLEKIDVERFNDAEATTAMLFYVRHLIEKTTKQLELGDQPFWLYEEIAGLAKRMDGDRYPELSEMLFQLSDKLLKSSH